MFKKYYKAANDDIKTNRELIDKIFETAEKQSKTVKFAKVYKIGTAIAAVFVVAAGAFLYPQIAKLNETPQISMETGQVTKDKNIQPANNEGTEQLPQKKADEPVVQQDNHRKTASEPVPEVATEDVNSGINAASETEDAQPFSIPERVGGRMIDAPPAYDTRGIAVDSFNEITPEETEKVQNFLKATFGEKDEPTGNALIFEIVGKAEGMYLGRWKGFVIDHSSLLCEFVLNAELTEMYECTYTENNTVVWNTQNNLLSN